MSKDRKRKFNWFLAWNYDSEEDSLSQYSKQGWRLEEVHTFHKIFVKDENQYRYRIDYRNQFVDFDEKKRYIETFEEMGWHYIGAIFNGWQYFEKQVKEGNTEEDYCIYTDNTSLKETLHRWIRLARFLELIILVAGIINLNNYLRGFQAGLPLAVTMLIEAILLGFGIISMKQKRIGIKRSRTSNIIIGNALIISMFACLVFGIAGTLRSIGHRPIMDTQFQGTFSGDKTDDNLPFVVKRSGWYDVNANCQSEHGIITFSIYDGEEEIYQSSGTELKIDEKLKLKEGIYRAVIAIDYGEEAVPKDNYYFVDLDID